MHYPWSFMHKRKIDGLEVTSAVIWQNPQKYFPSSQDLRIIHLLKRTINEWKMTLMVFDIAKHAMETINCQI